MIGLLCIVSGSCAVTVSMGVPVLEFSKTPPEKLSGVKTTGRSSASMILTRREVEPDRGGVPMSVATIVRVWNCCDSKSTVLASNTPPVVALTEKKGEGGTNEYDTIALEPWSLSVARAVKNTSPVLALSLTLVVYSGSSNIGGLSLTSVIVIETLVIENRLVDVSPSATPTCNR